MLNPLYLIQNKETKWAKGLSGQMAMRHRSGSPGHLSVILSAFSSRCFTLAGTILRWRLTRNGFPKPSILQSQLPYLHSSFLSTNTGKALIHGLVALPHCACLLFWLRVEELGAFGWQGLVMRKETVTRKWRGTRIKAISNQRTVTWFFLTWWNRKE